MYDWELVLLGFLFELSYSPTVILLCLLSCYVENYLVSLLVRVLLPWPPPSGLESSWIIVLRSLIICMMAPSRSFCFCSKSSLFYVFYISLCLSLSASSSSSSYLSINSSQLCSMVDFYCCLAKLLILQLFSYSNSCLSILLYISLSFCISVESRTASIMWRMWTRSRDLMTESCCLCLRASCKESVRCDISHFSLWMSSIYLRCFSGVISLAEECS